MPDTVKSRSYRSPVRSAAAERTRAAVVASARDLFARRGYGQTSVSEVALGAGVSVDTVYAAVGRKPVLMLAVIDDVLGEGRGEVQATARAYVEQVRAAPTARDKLAGYAAAMARIQPELAPLVEALREAGLQDQSCREAWSGLIDRRARNMRTLAADLRSTGEVRADLDDGAVADLVWATNSSEYFTLLTSRGWSPERYGEHLADLWTRLLLRS